jgi:hypothetical protein
MFFLRSELVNALCSKAKKIRVGLRFNYFRENKIRFHFLFQFSKSDLVPVWFLLTKMKINNSYKSKTKLVVLLVANWTYKGWERRNNDILQCKHVGIWLGGLNLAWRIIDRSSSGKGQTLNSSIWSWTFEDTDDVGPLQNPHRALNTHLMPSLPLTLWTHFYVRVFCTWLWSQGSVEHKQSTRLTQNPPLFF